MALTETDKAARRTRLGASELATVMGVPTFRGRNAYTLWLDKTGQLEREKRPAQWLSEGNRLEPIVLDYAESQLGHLERNVVVWDGAGSPVASTLDGRLIADHSPVEAKTSGIVGPIHGDWGEPGTDEVPDGYIIQCQVQLMCTGADLCHLYALLGGRGFVPYKIEPVPSLIATIRNVATDFYERYVATSKDPREDWAGRLVKYHGVSLQSDPCNPVLETVKRLRRRKGRSIQVAHATPFLEWDQARKARLAAEKHEKNLLAECLAILGDAEIGTLPDGRAFTYVEQKGADTINRKAMKADGVYDKYATPNRYRKPQLKRVKP